MTQRTATYSSEMIIALLVCVAAVGASAVFGIWPYTQIGTLQGENSQLQGQIATLTTENSQLRSQVSNLESEISQLQRQNSALQSENAKLWDQINSVYVKIKGYPVCIG